MEAMPPWNHHRGGMASTDREAYLPQVVDFTEDPEHNVSQITRPKLNDGGSNAKSQWSPQAVAVALAVPLALALALGGLLCAAAAREADLPILSDKLSSPDFNCSWRATPSALKVSSVSSDSIASCNGFINTQACCLYRRGFCVCLSRLALAASKHSQSNLAMLMLFDPHRYRLLMFGSGGSSRSSIMLLILHTMAFKLVHVEVN
jgi:hypothetical protein